MTNQMIYIKYSKANTSRITLDGPYLNKFNCLQDALEWITSHPEISILDINFIDE